MFSLQPLAARLMHPAILVLLLVLLVQACGIKGPLYLPTEEQKQEMAKKEAERLEAEQQEAEQRSQGN